MVSFRPYIMRALIALAVLACVQQESPPQDRTKEEEFLKKVQRINHAIDCLLNKDPELQAVGRKIILEAGLEAIPFLEQRLADQGYGEVYALLRELVRKDRPEERRYVDEKELPTDEEMEKELPKLQRDAVEKYVFTKYHEAWTLAKKGKYEQSLAMADAILVLEPRSRYADGIKRLRRYCDIRITQTTICEAKLIPSKTLAIAGEKIECVMRIRNVWKNPITIKFAEDGDGFAILDQSSRIPTMSGDVHEATKSEDVHFEKEIPIASGAQWEKTILLDTGTGLETSPDLRILTVQAWMQPRKVELGEISTTRRIVFEPATIKVLPRKHEKDLANPLEALGRYIDSGTDYDVFNMAMILEGEDREKGIELLIRVMQKANKAEGLAKLAHLLGFLTGEKLGVDPKKWLEWWEKRKK